MKPDRFVIALLRLAGSTSFAQQPGPAPCLDPNLSPERRAADLVSRMTLEEKVPQMQSTAPASALVAAWYGGEEAGTAIALTPAGVNTRRAVSRLRSRSAPTTLPKSAVEVSVGGGEPAANVPHVRGRL